jgi:hypothetical protein
MLEKEVNMPDFKSLFWEVLRWALMVVGGLLFVYGFGFGRWDACVLGLLLMQFAIAVSLKLKIIGLKSKL